MSPSLSPGNGGASAVFDPGAGLVYLASPEDNDDAFLRKHRGNGSIVTDVQSSDDLSNEGAGFAYELTTADAGGQDNSLFSLDSVSGQLAFTEVPDFENPQDGEIKPSNNQY